MASTGYQVFDPSRYLETDEDVVEFLEDIIETGDLKLITSGLGEVARSRGMTQLAARAGLSRESLYRALSAEGNPEFATIVKVLDAMGLRLSVRRKDEAA